MEYLFDLDKPYLTAWIELTLKHWPGHPFTFSHPSRNPVLLPYTARRGVDSKIWWNTLLPTEQVNAEGGYYMTPPVAAFAAGHFQTAKFLRGNGGHSNVKGYEEKTPLHSAEIPRWFTYCSSTRRMSMPGARTRALRCILLHEVSRDSRLALSLSNVARLLLETRCRHNRAG